MVLLMSAQLTSGRIFALSAGTLRRILVAQTHSRYKLAMASGHMMDLGAGPLCRMGIDVVIMNTATVIAPIGITNTVLSIALPHLTHHPHPIGTATEETAIGGVPVHVLTHLDGNLTRLRHPHARTA